VPRPAIRPYPVHYVTPWKLKDQTPVIIRPIRPEDEPMLVKFHETLSEESVNHRYFSALKLSQRVLHERLTRIVLQRLRPRDCARRRTETGAG